LAHNGERPLSSVPLLGHASLDEIIAYLPTGPVTVRTFLATALTLAQHLPAGRHFLNFCQDRYHFSVGLAAGLLNGQTSLQPASQSAETLRQIRRQCPNVFCLCDSAFDSLDLPRVDFPDSLAVHPDNVTGIPDIPGELLATTVYTSGSTGMPVPHNKSWGSLVRNARAEASRLGLLDGPRHAIVGTVPAQHMYGFESTVLLAMHGNSPFWSGKPFYPQDIVRALLAVPPPRMLVTTPFHLGTLLAAGVELPAVDRLLSATAPLSPQLAADAESRLAAPLHEIYGCTETGQLASRRLITDPAWLPLDGVCLKRDGDKVTASGGHIEGRVVLADDLELLPDGRFMLLGRNAASRLCRPFPRPPIVPGVVLLDRAILFAEQLLGRPALDWQVGNAKFFSPVGPGEMLVFALQTKASGAIVFTVKTAERDIASGSLTPPAP
jgi:acyl-coenzyme A synthetase/AMP-(fatty) acid ligase